MKERNKKDELREKAGTSVFDIKYYLVQCAMKEAQSDNPNGLHDKLVSTGSIIKHSVVLS